ncbi:MULTISPECIES: helix-turn-helix transcriptional regulator [Kocuria]|uniref:helix-turn-helix transcriptional regulator n=1 Tax=Kocuria TaxID=57493 RepID=UPI001FEFCC9E|nr:MULTISPECIES: helix-turn-helix transcriptional regulator [Kocuria]
MTVTVVRDGSAILLSEFGQKPINVGDVILLAANTLCGGESEEQVTVTTICADTDYVIDQVFWQHVGLLQDRLDAQDFAATIYTEPAQILRLGEGRAGALEPWLDELVALSTEHRPVENFYRVQALWFSIAHVIAPFIRTSDTRLSSTQRATTWPAVPRVRRFSPLRREARRGAELLRSDPVRHWSVGDLAAELHLSKSQVGRLFVDAYGKSPIAYLTMLRTERMARLIRTTDDPISMIARKVGWGDPDFAARQFRRSIGVTPRKYRSMIHDRAAQMVG